MPNSSPSEPVAMPDAGNALTLEFALQDVVDTAFAGAEGDGVLQRRQLHAKLRCVDEEPPVLRDGSSLARWDVDLILRTDVPTSLEVDHALRSSDVGMLTFRHDDERQPPSIVLSVGWYDGHVAEVLSNGGDVRLTFSARDKYEPWVRGEPRLVLSAACKIPLNFVLAVRRHSML